MRVYGELFLLGLSLGIGPCIWFCVPIVVPYIASTRKNWQEGLVAALFFSFSRTLAYVVLGFLAVWSFQFIEKLVKPGGSFYISWAAGVFVVLIGLTLIVTQKNIHFPLCKILGKELLQKSNRNMFLLGLLIGFSPCLPLFGALTLIASQTTSYSQGAALGLAFGLGTSLSPLLILGLLAGFLPHEIIKSPKIFNIFKTICGILLVLFGLYLIKGE
jgi:sulfite exporter TauE/SafE